MNKEEFLKCLPDKDDLDMLINECCENDPAHTTGFQNLQVAIKTFVEHQIECLEWRKKNGRGR